MSAAVLAEFTAAEPFAAAVRGAQEQSLRVIDAFSPIAMPELGQALAPDWTRVRWFAAAAGLLVAVVAWALQWWSSAVLYPLNAGARPLNSWPVYVGTVFEVGMLAAAIAGFAAFLAKAGLPRLNHPVFEIEGFERASQDRFFLAVACPEGGAERAMDWLMQAGALRAEPVSL